ncbi:MAG: TrkA family potassium uptake protein [Lamprobacter sp.]|uniref:potassium channel family protein n=1 Tax=Lamprobacter sp. TaxID=3100796 RepID=UPI002B25BC7B|nr:TrkA family potassium uptake protein [Lamprobacter sp.]MEA3643372.1 TrkA family potassium uptake protein [Lamprobacter sp.]
MRAAFIGSNSLTLSTAELLLEDGHQVIIIERDRERIDTLSERFDAGFVYGDGTLPDVLRDAEPENTDVLFCLMESDQTNILAGLIGRSLGFARVVPRVNDPQFQHIAAELGLEDSIMPNRAVAAHLKQMLSGAKSLELSSVIRGDAAIFSLNIEDAEKGPIEDLDLPERTRIVCLYRKEQLYLPQEVKTLKPGDEVILITSHQQLPKLEQRFQRNEASD